MQGCKSRDTKPELAIRSLVHRAGFRYRVSARPMREVRRSADMVFGNGRVAVFIDGCFWHGCPDHFKPPRTNVDYWSRKIGGNIRRDRDTDEQLSAAGWLVLRYWEHQLPNIVATEIIDAIRARRQLRDAADGA